MPQAKLIALILMIIPLIIILSFYLHSINSSAKNNIGLLDSNQDESFCEYGKIDIVSCETSSKTNLDSGCSEKQIKKWEGYKNYLNEKDCDKLSSESKKGEDKKLACNCLQQKIYDLIKNGNGNTNLPDVELVTDYNKNKPTTLKDFILSNNINKINYRQKYKDKLSNEFLDKVEKIAKELKTKPEYLIAIMDFETGGTFSPSIKNSIGAIGLIQFTKTTANNLKTSTTDLAKMSRIEQLDYVEKYLKPFTGKMNSLDDAYMAVFLPSTIGKPISYIISEKGDKYYQHNQPLDKNKDGYIQKSEAVYFVSKKYIS